MTTKATGEGKKSFEWNHRKAWKNWNVTSLKLKRKLVHSSTKKPIKGDDKVLTHKVFIAIKARENMAK